MTAADWLQSRTPPPPPQLLRRMTELVAAVAPVGATEPVAAAAPPAGARAGDMADELATVAEHALGELLERGDHSRAIALDLLAIDALVTYACEAAAESRAGLDDLQSWCDDFARRLARLRDRAAANA